MKLYFDDQSYKGNIHSNVVSPLYNSSWGDIKPLECGNPKI